MGGAKELKPQASSSLGAWWLPWWLSLRGTDEKKQNRKYHKSLMRQTPKNPPVQKGSAFSTKLGIVNSKQRASNLTDPYQKKKKKKEPDKEYLSDFTAWKTSSYQPPGINYSQIQSPPSKGLKK